MADVSPVLQPLYEGRRDEAELLAGATELDVFEAAALDRVDRLKTLLADDGELARAVSADGFTPLHLAAFFAAPRAAQILVERGAEIDAIADNPMRVTPLHSAAAARQIEIARLLLEHGADPNARQHGGFAPIHAAAQNGDAELVELLLERGADPALRTEGGRDAADFAAEAGQDELAMRLRQSRS
jgi:ankyrin repeat protein